MQTTVPPGIPAIGFGTSLLGEAAYEAILTALEVGYRHLDTAQTYGSEDIIGRAIKASGIRRDDLFVTTKVADINLSNEKFMPSVRESLDRLGLDRVDLLLIHWPSHRDTVPLADYMASLARTKALGLTRLVGVSNFPTALLEKAIGLIGAGEIVNNQVEVHPYLQNRKLRGYCAARGISVTAYMPLGKGRVLGDPVIRGIAERRGTSPAVVTLAWLLQSGLVVIPASTRRENIAGNLEAAKTVLTEAEMTAINATDRGERMINPAKAPAWD